MAGATLFISKASRDLLAAHVLSGSILGVGAPMVDGRYRITIDADVRAALDRLDVDPDRAIAMLCSGLVGSS